MSNVPTPHLRWYQFRLRSLLVAIVVISLGLSWLTSRLKQANRQHAAAIALGKLAITVIYDYQANGDIDALVAPEPPGPRWLRRWLGDDFFADVVTVEVTSGLGDLPPSRFDLQRLQAFPGLKSLDMSGCRFSDADLASLEPLRFLQVLNFSDNPITDSGLEHLKGLTELRELYLDNTQVTDAGLQQLAELRQLKILSLLGDDVSDSASRRYREQHPAVVIHRFAKPPK